MCLEKMSLNLLIEMFSDPSETIPVVGALITFFSLYFYFLPPYQWFLCNLISALQTSAFI